MKNKPIQSIKPQDIIVLLKLILIKDQSWTQISLAKAFMSQSEISASLSRSKYARLLYGKANEVARQPLMDLIQYGIPYVFPQQLGPVVRGIPTAHSASPLNEQIVSDEYYVWPSAKGHVRGSAIQPLYPSVLAAIQLDNELYECLALIDAVRVGKAREKNIALEILKQKIC